MPPAPDQIFQPLMAGHDFISSRLLYFFNNDDFADAEFAINEFDVFAVFLTSMAFLHSKATSNDMGPVLEDFHASMISAIVERIVAGQAGEVGADKEQALNDMTTKIFEQRFRTYFHIFTDEASQQGHHRFTKLADNFLENALKESGPQATLSRFTSFLEELFHETVELLQKTESLAGS